MNFMDQRITRAAESILDNENLTADLNDEAAQMLLDWGLSRAKEIVYHTVEFIDDEQAEEAMYRPMRALRRMLRTNNKWSAKVQKHDQDHGVTALKRILDQAETVYGAAYSPLDENAQAEILNRQDEFVTNPVAFIARLRSAIENPPQKL